MLCWPRPIFLGTLTNMNESWNYMASAASEFPNDNPALHDGAIWVCLRVSGPPRPVVRARRAAKIIEASRLVALVEAPVAQPVEPILFCAEPLSPTAPVELLGALDLDLSLAALETSPSATEERTLELEPLVARATDESSTPEAREPTVSVATPEAGTTTDAYSAFVGAVVQVALEAGATRAAALLPTLLDGGALDAASFTSDVRQALVAAKIVDESGGALEENAAFVTMAGAWRMVLRGETNDLAACGTSTLDVWSADLLKALGVGASGKVDVRRELRRRGVAAFGMLLAA
jgi:hypothetical protein